MTDKRILIYQDKNAATAFTKEVAEVCDASNSLISLFNNFQPWLKVTTLDLFISLVSDPAKFYDDTLLLNVKVQAVGVQPNPEKLAELISLHRPEYLNAVAGLPLTSDDCIPCKKVQIKPGRRAISKHSYESYQEYLTFSAGRFAVNEEAVNSSMDRFNSYAEMPEEIERYTMFTELVETLNRWDKVYPFSGSDRLELKRIFGLMLSKGMEGEFILHNENLKNAITNLRYKRQ